MVLDKTNQQNKNKAHCPIFEALFKIIGEYMKSNKRTRKTTGFADTKRVPHANHPAHYRKTGKDDIEYITSTHRNPAKINNKEIETIPLNKNFDKNDKQPAFVVPIVFEGKCSALGKENNNYSIANEDKQTIDNIFKTAPRQKVLKTSNSKKQAQKKKR